MLVVDFHAGGAGHVAGRVENDLDLVLAAAEALGLAEGQSDDAFGAAVDVLVGEQGVVRNVLLLLLAEHHIGGIVEHPLDQDAGSRRHEDGGCGVFLHHDRQAADMIEMAVGDDDQVEIAPAQGREIGRGAPAHLLGVQPAIHQDTLMSPSWISSELAPIPPSRFKSINFIPDK